MRLVHEHAEGWLDRLRRRFPDLEVEVCARPDRLPGLLATFRPTMAYSCKTAGIPGSAHRPLLDCPTLRWLHVGGSGYDHLAGWEMRPTCQSCRRIWPPAWCTALVTSFHPATCSCDQMPGVLG